MKVDHNKIQLGSDPDPSKNFIIQTPPVQDGTLEIRRGTLEAPGALVFQIPDEQYISNANGTCTRLPDGTQICRTRQLRLTYLNSSNLSGVWTFPVEFYDIPDVFIMPTGAFTGIPSPGGYSSIFREPDTPTNTSVEIWLSGASANFVSGSWIDINLMAIGRWRAA